MGCYVRAVGVFAVVFPNLAVTGGAAMPYQRVTVFPLRPGADPAALRELATRFSAIMVALEGCRLTCIDLLSDGSQLRSVSVWDFEENANAAAASIREPATWETAGMLAAAPTTTIGQVIDSSVR